MIRSFTLILLGQLQVLMLIAGLNWAGYTINLSFNAILAGIFVGASLALAISIIGSIGTDLSYNQEESNNV
jgi:uncharacterized membrane-anchored protein YitT (DUF2179 family)